MNKQTYREYLQSQQWIDIRMLKLIQASFQCEQCLSREDLQIHHLTYDRVGRERLSDLKCLCDVCHTRAHFPHLSLQDIAHDKLKRKLAAGQRWQRSIDKLVDEGLDRVTSRDVVPDPGDTGEKIDLSWVV